MTLRFTKPVKVQAIAVFEEMHDQHASRSMIAQCSGFSAAYVGEVLTSLGLTERWDRADDWKRELNRRYPALSEACERLAAIRKIPSSL